MSTLFSSRWYRVAGLKPTLSPRLLIRRQRVRGETWYVLADPVRGRSLRLNAAAYGMAARLDGERTVQQLWDSLSPDGGDAATQDETIELLAQLREAALVQFDRPADFDLLLPHLQESAQPRGRGNLLAWRVPLGDPTWLLQRLRPVQELCFTRTGLVLWLLAIATLLLQVLQHAPSLWAYGSRWIDSPRFVLLALLLFYVGGAFLLFAWRAQAMAPTGIFAPVSREGAIVLNNLLICSISAVVFVGTMWPMFADALFGAKVSVGSRRNNYMPEPTLSWFWDDFAKNDKRVVQAAADSFAAATPLWSIRTCMRSSTPLPRCAPVFSSTAT
jgi:hypothetical protein